MKKLFILLILSGIWVLGFPQDKTLIDESFGTFPPTSWSTLNNQGGSGTTVNWAKSGYPIVMPDANDQQEWLISPTISLDAANTYQIRFDYFQQSTVASVTDLTLLVSFNNGTTWDPLTANADQVWRKSIDGTTAEDTWYNTGYFPVAAPALTGSAKFAFRYTSTSGDLMQGIDKVLLQEDNGGGMVDYRNYPFENGITALLWTKLANQGGTGSTHTWVDNYLAKVAEDVALTQDEWLLTPKMALSDAEFTDLVVSYTYYNKLNVGSQGVQLFVANQNDWANFIMVDDDHFLGATSGDFEDISVTLDGSHYSPGDSLQFAFQFLTSVAGGVDFYLEHFTFETQFDETQVEDDAEVTLVPLDTILFPLPALYDNNPNDAIGKAEGFWTVAPDGWTNTGTNVDVAWYKDGLVGNHDYSARIDTVGADKVALNETLTSGTIAISFPPVGASYKLSFDWRNQTNLNAGLNTDPILGSGVDYDFADIKVEIKINSGAFTKIWQEDDAALLDSTSVTTGNSYFTGWTDFQDYLDNSGASWYKAVLDLNNYITATTTSIQIRINYTGSGSLGGYFNIDNLYVMQSKNPEFNMEAAEPFSVSSTFLSNYSSIPITQITNPYQLGAVITNNGVTTFTNNNLLAYVKEDGGTEETFGYKVLTPTVLPAHTTKYVTISNLQSGFTGGVNFYEGSHYALRYAAASLNGNAFNQTVSFDVSTTEFKKFTGVQTSPDFYVTADDSSGGMGTLFEFKKADVIDDVSIYLGAVNNTSDFNMSIIKVAGPTSTTGTLIYTSPLVRMVNDNDTYEFLEDISVTAGYYIFMFNQLDNYNLNIGYDDDTYTDGVIYRGSATKIYTTPDEVGELHMSLNIKENVDPVISTSFVGDFRVLIADKPVSLTFKATDGNNDSLTWTYNATPSWLVNWIIFTDNGDGTATLTGTPKTANLGTSDITVIVDDGRGGTDDYDFNFKVLSQIATFTPDYTENFTGADGTVPANWAALYDKETGSNQHWNISSNYMNIFGDNTYLQDEWLISPPIKLPNSSKSLDSAYRLEFDWQVYNFDYFCKGISGVLGSAGNGGFNYADVTLKVSIDNGKTWSVPIWKEDDPELVAPVTDGIDGGEKWGYLNNHFYTSVIDLSAYSGETVLFAFQYQSKFANYLNNSFSIDNFKVLRNNQVDISVIAFADYQNLPERQVDQTNGETFHAYIINQGIEVPDGATYTLSLPEVGYDESFDLNAAFFATGDTQMVEYTYYPQADVNQSYNFTATVTATGNATSGMTSHPVSTYIDPTQMSIENDDDVEEMSFGYYDGLGVEYELVNGDHLNNIYAWFGPSTSGGTPISISIIKVNDFGDTSGELIATIDDDGGTPITASSGGYNFYPYNDQDINVPPYLEAGKYIVMFNQLDEDYPLYLYKNNASYLPNNYIRGNFSNLYSDAYDQGNLFTYIVFSSNYSPMFVDENDNQITTYSAEVLQGESGTFKIYTADNNEFDVLGFEQVTDPSFLAPSWLSFTYSGDTAFMTIANTAIMGEYPAQLMVGDGVDTSTLSITIKINGPLFMSDEFTEPFDGWDQSNYPKVVTNNNTWNLKKGVTSKSTYDWYQSSNSARTDPDYSDYQNEWLISPYVYFTAPSNDTTYWLNFNWYIEEVYKMIGGTQGLIGSGDDFNDYNYADLRVKVSADGGNTWTLLWQEDDEDLVKAADSDMNYPYDDSYWYSSYSAKVNITSYAGQPLLFGFQYEGMQASAAGFDDIYVERVDPYVDLEITNYDVLPYYLPLKQAKNIDVTYSITNKGTATSIAATISAEVTNNNGDINPAYEETLQMAPLAGGASMEYSFPMAQATYGSSDWYNFYFNIYQPYNVNASYQSQVTYDYYSYDQGFSNDLSSDFGGQGLGQVFQIYEEDLLSGVEIYSYEYNYLVVNIVQLDSAKATSGTLIYTSSPQYQDYYDTFLDIEDVTLTPGYYAIFINDSESNETFRMGYSNVSGDNPGTYIKGDATGFETVEEDRFLYLRLYFNNMAPYFANSEGNSIFLDDKVARVGMLYNQIIRAIDEDEDDIPEIIGATLPSWITVTDNGDGFATISGTPTIDDLGDNLVVLRAIDGTDYDEDDFIIEVKENPAPEFITAPSLYAYVGKSYSYVAIASDMYGDDVVLTSTIPSWLTKTGTGDTITLSGTPTASNVGEFVVNIIATDENGMTSQQIFNILVVDNATPEFVSSPVLTASANIAYTYYVMATDANMGDVVTITAPTKPTWLTLSVTGNGRATLSGTPTAGGSFNVVLMATDAVGANSSQTYTIDVTINAAPVFSSTAITTATEDVLYLYNLEATDADGDYLYFKQEIMPNWLVMTVTGNGTAILQGIPTQKDAGDNAVSIKVGDGANTVIQDFTITVAEVNDPPIIVTPSVNDAKVGTVYQYMVEAFDEEGATLNYNANLPEWLSITNTFDGKAIISGIPEQAGDVEILVNVTDGNSESGQLYVLTVTGAVDVNDTNNGVVSIYPNPTNGLFNVSNIQGATIYLYNTSGDLIKHIENTAVNELLDLTSYSSGNYVIRIVLQDKVITKSLNLIK